MASIRIVGELHVDVDLAELWEVTLEDYVEQEMSLGDVEVLEVVEA